VALCFLQSLDLSHNRIERLDGGVFSALSGLKQLVLTQNPIQQVKIDAFDGLRGLLELSLSICSLWCLRPRVFASLKSLKLLVFTKIYKISGKIWHFDFQFKGFGVYIGPKFF
jgi:Leucine-rich repeat (LRR) protein